MADVQDRRPGAGGGIAQKAYFHDNGDGTYDLAFRAHLGVWNPTTSTFDKAIVNNATGGLVVHLDSNTAVGLSSGTGTGYAPVFADAITSTVVVSAGPGKFGGCVLTNLNATPAWLQVFDTTGAVSLGSTVPTFSIGIPANSTPANGVGLVLPLEVGISIESGVKVAATTTPKGNTLVATGLSGLIYVA